MKWIKTAIGAVIAISVIPLVVLCAINIKKSIETPKKIITTELVYYEDIGHSYVFKLNSEHFDKLIDYSKKGFVITNLYDYENNIYITITDWYNLTPEHIVTFDNNSVRYEFYDDSVDIAKLYENVYDVSLTDIVLMDIILTKNPIKNYKLIAALISFVPIIFAGGVVLLYYKPFKKD